MNTAAARLAPGMVFDGFAIGERLHQGGMADLFRVHYASGHAEPFPLVMKVPRLGGGEGAENVTSFEVEHQLLQVLQGPHVPRFVAAGDLHRQPYLVMEYLPGRTLQSLLDEAEATTQRPDAAAIARIGHAVAVAVHDVHRQEAVHQDLKPANVLLRPEGGAVLLDFGLGWHGHYPDLLAEEFRRAVGSPAWMAPEQVVGVRGDPRSDLFAIGVMLYELATGALPFGAPATQGGLRQRLWMEPAPPRRHAPRTPPWLQEIILRCLEPEAAQRYPSAAHLAFDLAHPAQVALGPRARRTQGLAFSQHLRRWIRAAGMHYQPSPLPTRRIAEVPIVMVAVPHEDVSEATLFSLRGAASRSLGIRPGARLAVVTVIEGADATAGEEESQLHVRHLERLRRWAAPLPLEGHHASYHVLEAGDVARALLAYAQANHVNLIVLGAATHGLALQRIKPTVPARVAMEAPCSVLLVKQAPPYALFGVSPSPAGGGPGWGRTPAATGDNRA
jgi:nucleotide-binding universal stress UspA family protein